MSQTSVLKELIEPLLSGMGIDLVDLELRGHRGSSLLRIYVDEPGGISLERCTSASRAIAACLDQHDPVAGHYTLEVSSPGVDRPLTTEKDFARHQGRKIDLQYLRDNEEQKCTGTIERAADGMLLLRSGESLMEIPLRVVVLAKIVLEFK
jgi:ribosome maturation factor RimP